MPAEAAANGDWEACAAAVRKIVDDLKKAMDCHCTDDKKLKDNKTEGVLPHENCTRKHLTPLGPAGLCGDR